MSNGQTTAIANCIQRLSSDLNGARAELLELTRNRLLAILRRLMTRFERLRRWEQSDDILQNVSMRLMRCLEEVPITSINDFLSLAALNMRRELLDLSRRYFGSYAAGTNYNSPNEFLEEGMDKEQAILTEWIEIHEIINKLPEDERQAVDLHWYHGLTQEETAEIVGVSLKTIKRRWLSAKLRLGKMLELPIEL